MGEPLPLNWTDRSSESALAVSQRNVLKSVAAHAPLSGIFEQLIRVVEDQFNARCAVLLAEAGSLRVGAAPNLPADFLALVDNSPIGADSGLSGAAAFLGQRIVIDDLGVHTAWRSAHYVAQTVGAQAAVSTPIWSHHGEVIGTFDVYLLQARALSEPELQHIDTTARLAALAIEFHRMSAQQRVGEARARQIIDTAYEGIWQVDLQGRTSFANRRMAEMLGYTVDQLMALTVFELTPHVDHSSIQERLLARTRGISEQHECRLLHKSGAELWCIVAASPTHDSQGLVNGSLGMVTDISDRKLAQARLERLSRIYAVSSSVNEVIVRVRDPDDLYNAACRIAVEQGGVALAWIAIRSTPGGKLHLVARCGGEESFVDRVIERIQSEPNIPGPAGRALRGGVPAVANDIASDSTFYWKDEALQLGMRSCAVFPLKSATAIDGIMAIYAAQPNYFSAEELRVLTSLAEDISFAVESSAQARTSTHASQALLEYQRMADTLFSNLPGMAYRCLFDRQWTMELVSHGCVELTHYSQDDLINSRRVDFERIVHAADRDSRRAAIATALAKRQRYEAVYRIVTFTNEQKWVWERGAGVFDHQGALRFLEGFITDITARREAEEQVAAQAALLDKANDAIVLYGLDDTVFYWNQGAARLYGWRAEEVIGQKITRLTCRDNAQRRTLIAQLMKSGEWSGELTQFTREGHEIAIEASWTLVCDDSGCPNSILAINTDITQRKKLETQYLNAQRLESIGTLAGGIAHDFNNILAAITGNAKLAVADLSADDPLRTPLREIEKAGLRAGELVRQILTFSRRQESRRGIVKLQDVATEALRLLRATLPAQIEIRTHFEDDVPLIDADATQIHQVIVNLGTNAAHAMSDQGGVLSVSLHTADIALNVDHYPADLPPGRFACLAVSDTGMGMDAEIQQRIFEPFFTTKAAGQGTGLGLSVVHGIVTSHEGAISVASRKGQGSCFSVFFRAADHAKVAAALESQSTATVTTSRGDGQHILYVDDEEALVFLATRVLERLGYKVTGRNDPRQALAEFKADPSQFDAVVSDLSMPGLTGPDLAREMLALRPHLPFVLTSGYIREDDVLMARKLGIRDLVLKPNTVEDLGNALHRVLAAEAVARV
jgi:PAS domain S-box-containing protein